MILCAFLVADGISHWICSRLCAVPTDILSFLPEHGHSATLSVEIRRRLCREAGPNQSHPTVCPGFSVLSGTSRGSWPWRQGPALRRIGNKEINNKYTPPCHVEKEVRREAKQNSMREGVCLGGARTLSYIIRGKSLRK